LIESREAAGGAYPPKATWRLFLFGGKMKYFCLYAEFYDYGSQKACVSDYRSNAV